ncbi:MAG: SDR family oxidoreductase [Candidatus Marinimicrobia bacterium]|nr:SDR family oxidoreductase [Candidatus Neomarinimicrobiota bacterium]MBL7009779.1 SDR family oxidoreductase [Candidatus Neomarinimicrobiota bacterium]MBL7029817.1 SDR family oxidoreductase [Candidatus Neomarinimicrobiota bacterium]
MNLSGKTFIVTGASSGIGKVLSKKLATKGAQIICASRNLDNLNRVVEEIKIQGGTAISVQTDITQMDQCQLLVEKTINHYGKLDALVLNAGISMWTPFESLKDVSFFRQLMETNYMGAVHCCHAALPFLKSSNGLIVNCSTGQALMGFPNHTGYAASKHALRGFLASLDIEMKGEIQFLDVIMGWIRGTGLRENAFGPNGQKLGETKRNHTSQSVPLIECVQAIVSGIENDKKVIYIPKKLRLVPFFNVFFKGLLNRKVAKAVNDHQD